MKRGLPLALIGVFLGGVCLAKEVRIVKGDYEAAVTANGIEVKHKGIPILCAGHLSIQKPEWKGMIYSARTQLANQTAKMTYM